MACPFNGNFQKSERKPHSDVIGNPLDFASVRHTYKIFEFVGWPFLSLYVSWKQSGKHPLRPHPDGCQVEKHTNFAKFRMRACACSATQSPSKAVRHCTCSILRSALLSFCAWVFHLWLWLPRPARRPPRQQEPRCLVGVCSSTAAAF